MKTLRDVLPREALSDFSDEMLNATVVCEYDGTKRRWIGREKYVFTWWQLSNGKAVGWNENPARGWSFPTRKTRDVH